MKAPKALLIDLDDTLIDYDGFAEEAWHRACEVISGGAVPVETLVGEILRYSSWYWSDPDRHREGRNNLEETRRITVREVLKRLGHPNDKMADEIGNRYISIREKKLHLFPGVRETLEKLKQRRMPMCLVTNGESHVQRGKIERFLLEPYFAAILIEGELGYGKPDVRVFKRALDILGTPAEETWMIGDNYEWEVIAPQKVGLTSVWVDREQNGPPADAPVQPHAVITLFCEVLHLIQAARNGD